MSVKRTLYKIVIMMMVVILPINTAGITVYHHFCFETGNITSKLTGITDCSDLKSQDQNSDICNCDDDCESSTSLTVGLNNSDLTMIDKIPCCINTSDHFVVSVPCISLKSDLQVNYSFTRDFELITFTSYSGSYGLSLKSPDSCVNEYNPVNYLIKTIQRLSSTKTDIPILA